MPPADGDTGKAPGQGPRITPHMSVLDAVSAYPATEPVFREMDTAKTCVLCDHLFDSLGTVAAVLGLEADRLLERLEAAVRNG